MNKAEYKTKTIKKTVEYTDGALGEVSYTNLITGKTLKGGREGSSIKFSQGGKDYMLKFCDMSVVSIDKKGYTLAKCLDGIDIQAQVVYTAKDSGVLAKTITVKADKDIFVEYVVLDSVPASGSEYLWQAPYAGKTYVPQSIARMGQPVYVGDIFLGGETPCGDNGIDDGIAHSIYHTGRKLSEVCQNYTYTLPDFVIGSGSQANFVAMRKAFFDYIDSIARPAKFRIQYNSWYDNMLDIDPERIKNSFTAIYEQFKKVGMRDLDCYVVDDGWTEYKKPLFWKFNDKFKDGFKQEAKLTESFGSKFGVWFGPRGGYTLQTYKYAKLLEQIGYHTNPRSMDICTADKKYIEDLCDRMAEFCKEYNVSYYKIDGFAKIPCKESGHRHPVAIGEGKAFYTYFWEEWIKGFEKIRSVQPDVCLNITSYVHCSPWFLKWVDYVWMNNASDMGFAGQGDDLSQCLNYRDGRYRNFYEERQLQFPACHMYNHEPCYAFKNTNVSKFWKKKKTIRYTDEQFATYLKCCMMRGSGLAELYFSPEMLDGNKCQIVKDTLEWTEKHFDIIATSQFFGGKPEKGQVYGYYAHKGDKHIIMVRNSSRKTKSYDFDLLGVGRIQGQLAPFEIKFIENI